MKNIIFDKSFIAQVICVFAVFITGFSNDVSGQSCLHIGVTVGQIGKFCDLAVDTNSTNPSDWTIKGQQVNSNTITLAVVLQQVDIEPWSISRTIPAGKYVRIRYGNITGTATATINPQQQETGL